MHKIFNNMLTDELKFHEEEKKKKKEGRDDVGPLTPPNSNVSPLWTNSYI